MRRFVLLFAIAALSMTAAAPAHAMMIGGEVYGMFNTHTLEDWNDEIDEANEFGADFDNITNGISGGIGARMWPNPNWMVSVAWEPFFLTTEDGSTELKLDANGFLGTVGYFFPTTGTARYGIGAGLGYYILAGEISDTGGSFDLEGSTIGFHFLGMGEWTVSPGFAVTASAGYRIADIADTELDGMSQDPEFSTDYSGFTGRVGLAFYLPNSN